MGEETPSVSSNLHSMHTGGASQVYVIHKHVIQTVIHFSLLQVFLDWSCGRDRIEVKDIEVLEHILLDWHIWHQASEEVWSKLLQQLEELLNPNTADAEMNQVHFQHSNAIVKILLMSKVYVNC